MIPGFPIYYIYKKNNNTLPIIIIRDVHPMSRVIFTIYKKRSLLGPELYPAAIIPGRIGPVDRRIWPSSQRSL